MKGDTHKVYPWDAMKGDTHKVYPWDAMKGDAHKVYPWDAMKGDTHKVYPWDAMNKMDQNGLIQILRKKSIIHCFLIAKHDGFGGLSGS